MIPSFLYGTAWKEERTRELVVDALNAGFTGIDTANQRKHYFEEAVGLGIQHYLNLNHKKRNDLFIQSKFTYASGQDSRKPYNENDSFQTQVLQSFASTLDHLHTDYLDSFVLHGPFYNQGLIEADWEVWDTMESLVHKKQVKFLGISNVTIHQLETLYNEVAIKPAFVQNRCFAVKHWDKEIREFCTAHHIIYQGFSLLTANQNYLLNSLIKSIAVKYRKTIPQVVFCFAKQIGILPLTGTSNRQHMHEDLDSDAFQLTVEELKQIETISYL